MWNTGHSIQWAETTVIEQEGDWYRFRVKEALYIRISPVTLNTDPGLHLNPCWTAQRSVTANDVPPE